MRKEDSKPIARQEVTRTYRVGEVERYPGHEVFEKILPLLWLREHPQQPPQIGTTHLWHQQQRQRQQQRERQY